MIKRELQIFFTALMFYTRIPCPSWVEYSEDYLNQATRYFPLIGWVVGASTALLIYVLQLLLPISVVVILSLAFSILLTGAFHEDGFADVCDGFGGGWTKERILEIMKDSRVGAYGAVGMIVLLALKITSSIELLQVDLMYGLKAIILGHVLSRFSAVIMIFTHEYSRADATSKVKPIAKKLTFNSLLVSIIWVVPALLLFQNYWIGLVLLPVYGMKMYLASYFSKWIGGYTGDCLGATQQVNEIVTLLFCLGLCKYI